MSRKADDEQIRTSRWLEAAKKFKAKEGRGSVEAMVQKLERFLNSEEFAAARELLIASKYNPILLFRHSHCQYCISYSGFRKSVGLSDDDRLLNLRDFAEVLKEAGKSAEGIINQIYIEIDKLAEKAPKE